MKKSVITILIFTLFILLVNAAVPNHISYQGKVDDASGQPMASGSYQMTFSLYRAAVGGTAVWSSGSQTVVVTDGLFSYELGAIVPFPSDLVSDSALWLEVGFGGEIISPRTQFSSVGFALKAQTADTALFSVSNNGWIDDGSTVSTSENVVINSNLYVDSIKIGTANHEGLLHVEGSGNAVAVIGSSADGWGVMGRAYGASGVGLYSIVDQAKGLVIDRNGGPNVFLGATDTGLYINTYGSGYAGIFDGKVKITGTTDFMAPITTQGVNQAASWNVAYGTGSAVHGLHDGSGPGKCFVAERNGGALAFIGGPDTGLYINSYGSGYAGIFDGKVKITGTTDFMAPITTQGVNQAASWNVAYGTGSAVHGLHDGSGPGKCFVAERNGGALAFIGGPDTGLYINSNGSGIAGRFEGIVEVSGNLGAGVSLPDAQLQVKGGNWNPGTTEGDFKVGSSAYRFKIGVAMSGGGAGDVRMRADGGTSRLILGSALNDVLAVNDTRVGIGTLIPNYTLDVRGNIGNNTTLYHSDKRWKKNIHPLKSSLKKILQLQGVSFDWKTKQFADMNFPTGTKIGLIAQDVEKILPNLVHTDKDGYKSVEYANIVALLVEAIKEQQKEIIELKRLIKEK